ncbi:MAG: hypothetical protein OXC46_11470 [Thaumarchaeota archaeon]|nr:hypothetical protein [Nitrososphaerota archaeon]
MQFVLESIKIHTSIAELYLPQVQGLTIWDVVYHFYMFYWILLILFNVERT